MADPNFPFENTAGDSTVILHDEAGRELPCQVEQIFPFGDREYLLLLPIDHPIEIFVWREMDGEEVLMDAEDAEIDTVFATAKAVLAEHNLTLQRTAIILTAAGELPEANDDNCISIELDEVDEAGQPQSEEFQILATCFYKDEEYTLCTPLDPLLMFASRSQDNELELVDPEDLEDVRSELEAKLFDMIE